MGSCVLGFQAIAARKLLDSRGPNRVFDAAATLAKSASLKRRTKVVAKSGAEVGGAIARGGAVIAKGSVEVLAAGPNLAATLINAHAEVGTRWGEEAGDGWSMSPAFCRGKRFVEFRPSHVFLFSPRDGLRLQIKPEGKTARFVGRTAGLWGRIVGYARHPRMKNAVVSDDSLFSQVRPSRVSAPCPVLRAL